MKWSACSAFSHVNDGMQLELPTVYPDSIASIIKLDDKGARNLT
jgi:hypothetical protein